MVGDVHASRYDDDSNEISWQNLEAREALREKERQEAYKAVSLALANHRWWGWGSITRSIRMWVTGVKFRLGMKLWP